MAPRIEALRDEASPAQSRETLRSIGRALGITLNLHRTLAHSRAALDAYMQMSSTLSQGALDAGLRESIAIATASRYGCVYCASAHSLLGRNAGLTENEISQNLRRAVVRRPDVRRAVVGACSPRRPAECRRRRTS